MNIPFPLKPLAGLVVVAALSGCSAIAGLFPDKQKQYRYSSDLPPLEIPPDLSSSTIEGAKVSSRQQEPATSEEEGEERKVAAASDETEEAQPAKRRPAAKPASSSLAQNAEDVPHIEIEEPFAEAWNDVHRALGRLEVEVTDRNRSEGVFYVNYGGSAKPAKDEETSLWGEFKSLFTGPESEGEAFRVVLEEGASDSVTTVSVRDSSDQAATDGLGLQLLKQLNEKLKTLDDSEPDSAKDKDD